MSKSKMSELTRGAGMAADLWQKLEVELKQRGGSGEELGLLVGDAGAGLRGVVADRLIRAAATCNRYPVKARYPSLADAIAAGRYDYVSDLITAEHFGIPDGEIVVDTELVLYRPNRSIRSDDVVRELDQRGLKAATLQELTAFGERYPDVQREFPVIALGSVYVHPDGRRRVPYLDRWDAERKLSLSYWGGGWGPYYRFLAARK